MGAYLKGPFSRGSNLNIKLKTFDDKIFIPSIIQSYILHWYHTYLLHPGMYIMETAIHQHLYWTGIRNSVRKEVNNCDTCQRTKRPNENMVIYQLRKLSKYHGTNSV